MVGNDQVRFCGQCELNVFNLSSMTKSEAEHLIAGSDQRLCVKFYRRRDGSIITQDCPVGLRAFRRRISRLRNAVAATLFGFLAGLGGTLGFRGLENALENSILKLRARPIMGAVAIKESALAPEDPPTVGRVETMGMLVREPIGRRPSKPSRRSSN